VRAGRGRYFSDRIDAQRVLLAFFWSHHPPGGRLATGEANMVPLTICRLTMAVVFGLGTGAVFKLIALEFPAQVGAVTGVVGATAACRLLPLPS